MLYEVNQYKIKKRVTSSMTLNNTGTLQYKYPEIAKEWHPTKNLPLTLDSITYGSNKKVWWQCPDVKEHSYQATVKSRTRSGIDSKGCLILRKNF